MMKKTYLYPSMRVTETQHELPLAASGVTSELGIGYSGVDDTGTQDPDVKGNYFGNSLFDE